MFDVTTPDGSWALPNGKEFVLRVIYSSASSAGATVVLVAACISLVPVVGLLAIIFYSTYKTRNSREKNLFVHTHAAAYVISLLFCNLVQCISTLMNAHWIHKGAVEYGRMCEVQAFLKQFSNVGMAVWTLAIAINTFCVLFLRLELQLRVILWLTLTAGWFGISAIVISGPTFSDTDLKGPFYGISGSWCSISLVHRNARFFLDYFLVYLSLLSSFVMYTLVYLRLRGNIVTNGWRVWFRKTSDGGRWLGSTSNESLVTAKRMLLYPVVYCLMILPVAITRIYSSAVSMVTYELSVFSATLFMLSGFVNVVLFTTTRRILPPNTLPPFLGRYSIFRSLSADSPVEPEPEPSDSDSIFDHQTKTYKRSPFSIYLNNLQTRQLSTEPTMFSDMMYMSPVELRSPCPLLSDQEIANRHESLRTNASTLSYTPSFLQAPAGAMQVLVRTESSTMLHPAARADSLALEPYENRRAIDEFTRVNGTVTRDARPASPVPRLPQPYHTPAQNLSDQQRPTDREDEQQYPHA
ncbi:hypothetical protein HGRIS_007035 [Hohenbuehelia grisea]|uniref:G-protein coupled receptors family 1 profile domain-containing protein n=1 Tax=Hohenbuehelia grisea TaxID=104357 RepID=A0ABR3JCG5_9AGAR